jgi:hypothetical protein
VLRVIFGLNNKEATEDEENFIGKNFITALCNFSESELTSETINPIDISIGLLGRGINSSQGLHQPRTT